MNNIEKYDERGTPMKALSFGYKCQECGQGRVQEKVLHEYNTKLKGSPLTVKDARIGVCNRCGAHHFDPNETARWRTLFEEKHAESYLQPSEIRDLQKQLGLSMEQFAALLGSTRQSLYNWQRPNRSVPQSRMADLFMRLIRESHRAGEINVLDFLTSEAAKLGFDLKVSPRTKSVAPIVMFPRKNSLRQLPGVSPQTPALAADSEALTEEVVLVLEHDKEPIARLVYDYLDAALKLVFLQPVPFSEFDAEIQFTDGKHITVERVMIEEGQAVLLASTESTEENVAQVRLLPR
jgi:YgiT-type zinc finger domain-containing protein